MMARTWLAVVAVLCVLGAVPPATAVAPANPELRLTGALTLSACAIGREGPCDEAAMRVRSLPVTFNTNYADVCTSDVTASGFSLCSLQNGSNQPATVPAHLTASSCDAWALVSEPADRALYVKYASLEALAVDSLEVVAAAPTSGPLATVWPVVVSAVLRDRASGDTRALSLTGHVATTESCAAGVKALNFSLATG